MHPLARDQLQAVACGGPLKVLSRLSTAGGLTAPEPVQEKCRIRVNC
jgi:hypothetical protein